MKQVEFLDKIVLVKDKIYRLSLSILKDHQSSQDATQEVIIKLWNHRKKMDKMPNFIGYTLRITKNHCFDVLRKQAKVLNIQKDLDTPTVDPSKEYESKDLIVFVEKAINQLPDLQRVVIQLRDVEQMDFTEIATVLSSSEAAVRMNLSRARRTIKDYVLKMESYGVSKS